MNDVVVEDEDDDSEEVHNSKVHYCMDSLGDEKDDVVVMGKVVNLMIHDEGEYDAKDESSS